LLCQRLGEEVLWAVTGSTGLALQGVRVEPHDIDLQTDARGAYRIEELLTEFVKKKVVFSSTERICSHVGAFEIEGLVVEVMGALQKRLPDGTWEAPVDVALHRRFVRFKDLLVPVISLEHELRAYRLLGREETARRIEARLREVSGF